MEENKYEMNKKITKKTTKKQTDTNRNLPKNKWK